MTEYQNVFAFEGPEIPDVPILFDSPHSGSAYPDDFRPTVPMEQVRGAEDMAVDQLFGEVPANGLPLLKALFPRIYCDVNRARTDLEYTDIDGILPFLLSPTAKAKLGKGVVWMMAPPPPKPVPLYENGLAVPDILHRLKHFWLPYREALAKRLAAILDAHGHVIYIDCHSMQSVSTAMHEEGAGTPRPDIVLGDRRATSCAPWVTMAMAKALRREGFGVAINIPYQGADLVSSLGAPADGVHALQVEVRRDLYMNEKTLTLTDRFHDTRARLGRAVLAFKEVVNARAI